MASAVKEPSNMMKHYLQMKEKYSDCILFYRLGDFYELFYDDAIEISRVLELTLTGKACGLDEKAPMCGVPYHAAEGYIAKLVSLGYKVAVCEQLTEPKKGVKIELITDRLDDIGKDVLKCKKSTIPSSGTILSHLNLNF